jgi:hypothetical protein
MAGWLCIEYVAVDTYDKFMGGTVKTSGLIQFANCFLLKHMLSSF